MPQSPKSALANQVHRDQSYETLGSEKQQVLNEDCTIFLLLLGSHLRLSQWKDDPVVV